MQARYAAGKSQLGSRSVRAARHELTPCERRQLCGNRRLYFHLAAGFRDQLLFPRRQIISGRSSKIMTDQVRHPLGTKHLGINHLANHPFSRRRFLATSAVAAASLAASALPAARVSFAADLKTVRFSEAVHNLGYINLYVGMHAGIFKKNGLDMQVSAAGGDTQTFAAVLGGSADFAIGDATMAQISRENGGPGVVVGTVVQRAHYFGVSKTLQPITDPKQFKGLKIVTSPEPNTNYSVAKRLLEQAGLKVGVDATIVPVNPGTEIAAMLAGQADIAIAYQPSVAAAEAQGANVVFDFSNYIGPFCNTGIMVLPTTIQKDPEMVQALVTSFEESSRKTYADPAFAKEVARKEFPELPGEVVDKAIDADLKYLIPAQSVVTKPDQWKNLMDMQVYLGNAKGSVPFDQIIDNSFADKAVASLK
jgi:NitT/TauT family transport system substrate-binding protein